MAPDISPLDKKSLFWEDLMAAPSHPEELGASIKSLDVGYAPALSAVEASLTVS
jgi:hypothetical protein